MSKPKGTLNKNKKFLLTRLQDMYGESFHPIMKMAENADRMQTLINELPDDDAASLFVGLKTSIDAWEKIAQYTEPKLKAVEHSGKDGKELIIHLTEYVSD